MGPLEAVACAVTVLGDAAEAATIRPPGVMTEARVEDARGTLGPDPRPEHGQRG